MTKFNFTRGSGTKKGAIPTVRVITKEHTFYHLYYDEQGRKRTPDEVKAIVKKLEAIFTAKVESDKKQSEQKSGNE